MVNQGEESVVPVRPQDLFAIPVYSGDEESIFGLELRDRIISRKRWVCRRAKEKPVGIDCKHCERSEEQDPEKAFW